MSLHHELKRQPTRRRAGLMVLAAGVVLAGWIGWVQPWLLVMSAYFQSGGDTPQQTQLARSVAACGVNGLPATLWAAETGFGWDGRFAWTPQALRGIGEPAHKALIERVQRTAQSTKRHRLILLLQVAFSDYRFLKDWIREVPAGNSMDGRWLQSELTRICGETCPEVSGGGVRTEIFREYYETCSGKLNLPASSPDRRER